MGKIWDKYRKHRGKIWENMGNIGEKYGYILERIDKNHGYIDIETMNSCSLVQWLGVLWIYIYMYMYIYIYILCGKKCVKHWDLRWLYDKHCIFFFDST